MYGNQLIRRENKCILREYLNDTRGNLVRFLCTVFNIKPCGFAFIVAVDQVVGFFNSDVAVNVLFRSFDQVIGRL